MHGETRASITSFKYLLGSSYIAFVSCFRSRCLTSSGDRAISFMKSFFSSEELAMVSSRFLTSETLNALDFAGCDSDVSESSSINYN